MTNVAPVTTSAAAPAGGLFGGWTWGSNGQTLTPAQAAAKQRIAESLIASMSAPRDVGEGLSSIAHAIMAKDMMNQSQDAISAGTAQASADMEGILKDPSKSIQFLANDLYASPGQQSVAEALASQQTPGAQVELDLKKAQLHNLQGGFGAATDKDSNAERFIANANGPGGDTSSLEYAMNYNTLYGPKDISVPGPEGVPIIQHITPSIPNGIAKPTYNGQVPAAPAPGDPVPLPPGGMKATGPATRVEAQAAPAGSPDGTTSQTINTGDGGSVQQFGIPVSRNQYNANRAMTVSAPALKSLHENMAALGDAQNRVALSVGEWGKFLASDDGKKALDAIRAIANTVASAQNLNAQDLRDELTPLSTDSPALRQYRLSRADEYVKGLASGNDTAASTSAVNDAIATPSADGQSNRPTLTGAPGDEEVYKALPSGAPYIDATKSPPVTRVKP